MIKNKKCGPFISFSLSPPSSSLISLILFPSSHFSPEATTTNEASSGNHLEASPEDTRKPPICITNLFSSSFRPHLFHPRSFFFIIYLNRWSIVSAKILQPPLTFTECCSHLTPFFRKTVFDLKDFDQFFLSSSFLD